MIIKLKSENIDEHEVGQLLMVVSRNRKTSVICVDTYPEDAIARAACEHKWTPASDICCVCGQSQTNAFDLENRKTVCYGESEGDD